MSFVQYFPLKKHFWENDMLVKKTQLYFQNYPAKTLLPFSTFKKKIQLVLFCFIGVINDQKPVKTAGRFTFQGKHLQNNKKKTFIVPRHPKVW